MSTNENKQPIVLAEGTWPCVVLSGSAGEDSEKLGVIKVRINVRLDDGPSKGRTTTYEEEVNNKSSLYVSRSMTAVGWKGKTITSFADDCAAWVAATGGKSTAEIKHIHTKKGTIWDKCNSIGRGRKPLAAPSGEALSDADKYLRAAMVEDGSAPPDESGATGANDDIPFATISTVSLGEIAKVLR